MVKFHGLLLSNEGDIYAFGRNNCGQLGNKFFQKQSIPTKIIARNKFIDIASHYDCEISAALSVEGIYYVWGLCGQDFITGPKETTVNLIQSTLFFSIILVLLIN